MDQTQLIRLVNEEIKAAGKSYQDHPKGNFNLGLRERSVKMGNDYKSFSQLIGLYGSVSCKLPGKGVQTGLSIDFIVEGPTLVLDKMEMQEEGGIIKSISYKQDEDKKELRAVLELHQFSGVCTTLHWFELLSLELGSARLLYNFKDGKWSCNDNPGANDMKKETSDFLKKYIPECDKVFEKYNAPV